MNLAPALSVVVHGLEGENVSNKSRLESLLGQMHCLCDTSSQKQLRAKIQTCKALVETGAHVYLFACLSFVLLESYLRSPCYSFHMRPMCVHFQL